MAAQVSVIIPVKNGDRYIAAAIDSILIQTVKPSEIIVVDGLSTDKTVETVQRFGSRIRLITEPCIGSSQKLNIGVKAARGQLLSFLDADDLWAPDKLRLQLSAFAAYPQLEACFGFLESFRSPDLVNEDNSIQCPVGRQPAQLAGAMLVRRAAFDRVGLFDPAFRYSAFIDWWSRAQEAGLQAMTLDETVLHRRIHDANVSILRRDETRSEFLRIAMAATKRRAKKTDITSASP